MTRTFAATALLLLQISPLGLEAQSRQRFSVQISGIGNLLFGDAETSEGFFFGAPSHGGGGELQLRFTPSAFSIGAGLQVAIHGSNTPPDFGTLEESSDQSFTLSGIFVEPRYVFGGSGNRAFYGSGRLALSTIKGDNEATGYDCEGDPFCDNPVLIEFSSEGDATGFTLNVGGGMLIALTDRVNLDVGATAGLKDFGELDVSVGEGGAIKQGSLGRFTNIVMRVGLAIGLGG